MTTETPEASDAPEAPVAPAPSRVQTTGKRKTSIARVIMEPGSGELLCNGRPIEEFFGRETLVAIARRPLGVAAAEGRFKITARLHGGGVSGQAGALSHGIARALIEVDESLRPVLKAEGLLTRDARIKERKKAGLKGARKRPQFSKR